MLYCTGCLPEQDVQDVACEGCFVRMCFDPEKISNLYIFCLLNFDQIYWQDCASIYLNSEFRRNYSNILCFAKGNLSNLTIDLLHMRYFWKVYSYEIVSTPSILLFFTHHAYYRIIRVYGGVRYLPVSMYMKNHNTLFWHIHLLSKAFISQIYIQTQSSIYNKHLDRLSVGYRT